MCQPHSLKTPGPHGRWTRPPGRHCQARATSVRSRTLCPQGSQLNVTPEKCAVTGPPEAWPGPPPLPQTQRRAWVPLCSRPGAGAAPSGRGAFSQRWPPPLRVSSPRQRGGGPVPPRPFSGLRLCQLRPPWHGGAGPTGTGEEGRHRPCPACTPRVHVLPQNLQGFREFQMTKAQLGHR